MANRLVESQSPYLLQHKDNPVDWYPWGDEALEKAKQEDKPIFLSIGYAACHWCHVMAHESFEDPEIAEIMNEHFVNIKVDREERPDLDNIYMKAVVAMTGQGGWPMSVFLTPEGEPFYGGTYFPPQRRGNMPSFQQVLTSIARAWNEDREQLLESSAKITRHLQSDQTQGGGEGEIDGEYLENIVQRLYAGYDWVNGGWGQAPKFPQAMTIDFLLAQSTRGNQDALDMASHVLTAMAKGGMYDVVGGGFSRYSVDQFWLVPHFEKMLYDNALLSSAYLHAYLLTDNPRFQGICEHTLDFVARELRHEQGGFYSSLDADSEGEEGKYYLWTKAELEALLPDPDERELFMTAYDVSEEGNFEGKTVLQRARSDEELAQTTEYDLHQVKDTLHELNDRLYQAREERVRPSTDDKVLTSWNGLMLRAFAEAGRYLDHSRYTQIAQENADFLLNALQREDGRLFRAWRQEETSQPGYLEDYAALILGLLSLYQTDEHVKWYRTARDLTEDMLDLFYDPQGGFFDTGHDQEKLLYRPQEIQDNATPSGSALAATALLLMAGYEINLDWHDIAVDMIEAQQKLYKKQPVGFGQWLQAADLVFGPLQEVAIVGHESDQDRQKLVNLLWNTYRPRAIGAVSDLPVSDQAPTVLHDRPMQDGNATAYICQGTLCKPPITDPESLQTELNPS